MKNSIKNPFRFVAELYLCHRVLTVLGAVVIIGIAWWGYGKLTSTAGETRYVVANVERRTVVASVSASGQVSASNQLDVKARASGDVISVPVTVGQQVKAGAVLAVIDPTTAQKAVRDAEVNYQSAKLSLEKIKRPTETLTLIQAENSLTQATNSLAKSYEDGFNYSANAYLDLPNIVTGLNDILYGHDVNKSSSQDNSSAYADMVFRYDETVSKFKEDAIAKYDAARKAYDAAFLEYRGVSRSSSTKDIEHLIQTTYSATKAVADAVKSQSDFLGFVEDRLTTRSLSLPTSLTSHKASISSYTSKTNSHLINLANSRDGIVSSKLSIQEKTQSLADLKEGADVLDIQSSELTVKQRYNALVDAQNTLEDYYIRAPFDGVVAAVPVTKYTTASSGTIVATLMTAQKMAELSLNEVDAAKVKVNDKVTLTFDAIDELSLTGKVAEIDAAGTVTQGVVSYSLKIRFDSQDDRVKPGMTVNAAIVAAVQQDVLTVPVSAVKRQGAQSTVQVFDTPLTGSDATSATGALSAVAPHAVPVQTGLSDDVSVEIVSGLTEGQQVVVRTVTAAAATTQTAPSLFGGGATRGVTGGVRTQSR
jgi:HlyD family secretion protein